jgi:N-acetyl-gamma-glutamyl-phosphate reductase
MKCGVVGATGYLGAELLRLLAGHPDLDVVAVQAESTAGTSLGEVYPGLAPAYGDLAVGALEPGCLGGCDVVFVALPSGVSQAVVSSLVDKVRLVVDLGADFRLRDPALYEQWYGFSHSCPDLIGTAVYGLPELFRDELREATLVAAPGCYPTAASLALCPLVAAGLIERSGIIVDAASGTSGAGKSPSAGLHHPLVNERLTAYGLLTHRHTPEMEQVIGAEVLFTPHLAPMTRGILATCYARRATEEPVTTDQVVGQLRVQYAAEPFVHVSDGLPSTSDAYGSNVAHLTARVDRRTGWVVVISAIDNLVKGGAGQAVQAANVALGLAETAGLPTAALSP